MASKLEREIQEIKDHISVLNDETGQLAKTQEEIKKDIVKIKVCVTEVKTNVDWLKRSYWIVAGASIAALVSNLL